jgi:cell shape-determining protein MreC
MTRAQASALLPKTRVVAPRQPVAPADEPELTAEEIAAIDRELSDTKIEVAPDDPVAAGSADEVAVLGAWIGKPPEKLSTEDELRKRISELEESCREQTIAANGRLDELKRKTSQCVELQTQVDALRQRCQDLDDCEAENEKLRAENEKLRERMSIMEEV